MAHYKRSMQNKMLSPGEYVYQVLCRASRFVPIRTANAKRAIRKLAKKYSTTPKATADRLISQIFGYGAIGINNGKPCYDQFELWHQSHRPISMCWVKQRKECAICFKPVYIKNKDDEGLSHCQSEWCARLFEFYYEQGRPRPNLRHLGIRLSQVDGETRFNFFLTDFLKRSANEQTRT